MNSQTRGSEVVYAHQMRNEDTPFHIGSGSEQRAHNFTRRSTAWLAYVASHGGLTQIDVKILEWHHCPARSRLREMEFVNLHQPETNTFGRVKPFPEGILDGRPKRSKERCTCGAPDCYGAEVAAEVAARRAKYSADYSKFRAGS
jgi:hypothetical protein